MTQMQTRPGSLPMTPTEAIHAARQEYVQRVLRLLQEQPDLPYLTVAFKARVSLRTVTRITADAGIRRKRGQKPGRLHKLTKINKRQ